ncbi:MAG: hypothetical protein JRI45_11235 [Deltaproteobacteria bacterium]|nr:hypothetical protein [Deltaproteobacteria bacterium]MBW2069442.1 hypothetical protein [Deltaproteobacteria bacterium]
MADKLVTGSTALVFFIICPRMAAMLHIISKYSRVSVYLTTLLGSLISAPLVLLMVAVFSKFGIWGALSFCVVTDLASVLIVKELNFRAGIETLIITLFVIAGVKAAPLLSKLASR